MDVKNILLLTELRDLLPALRQLAKGSPAASPMSLPPQPLADLMALIRTLFRRVTAIEYRTGASEPMPLMDIEARLERLERHWAIYGNGSGSDPLSGLVRRIEALEARRNPPGLGSGNAARVAHGEALRAVIADILRETPEATGPVVLERLRVTHAGKLPSERTVRWHLQALRGNGNTVQGEGESVTQALENPRA